MKYYPEFFYKSENLNKAEIIKRFKRNELVAISAISWDDKNKSIVARLGNGLFGYILEDEICIETLKFTEGFKCSVQAHSIIGQTICALITSIDSNKIILSRKKLQEKALKSLVVGDIYKVCIKSITNIGIFADVAVGLSAFIHNSEITKTQFNSTTDLKKDFYLFHGKTIPAKLLSINGNIKMSLRQTFNFPLLSKGDTIYGVVRNKLADGTGYFVDISPNDTAIVDTEQLLYYGDKILVQIKSSECVFEDDNYYNKHHVKLVIK